MHGKKNGKSKWASLRTSQELLDRDDPMAVIIDWGAAEKAVKPFEEFESRRKTLLATIKTNKDQGAKIMQNPRIVRYQTLMRDLNHNFREFARREGQEGRFFKQWLEAAGLTAEYHKLFQVQQVLASSQFDDVREEVKKANVFFDAYRAAQKELDELSMPEGGGE
jgi:hypothetical protein